MYLLRLLKYIVDIRNVDFFWSLRYIVDIKNVFVLIIYF